MYRRFSSIVPSAAVFLDAPSASPVRQPWLSIPGFPAPVGVLAASIGLPADLPDAAFSSTQSNSSRPDTAGPLDSHRFVHSQFVARCGYAILGKTCDDSVPFWYLSRATCRDSAVIITTRIRPELLVLNCRRKLSSWRGALQLLCDV